MYIVLNLDIEFHFVLQCENLEFQASASRFHLSQFRRPIRFALIAYPIDYVYDKAESMAKQTKRQ